jgi:hypothetical protein
MRTLRGMVITNYKYDTPPQEYGVLTLGVLPDHANKIEKIDIFIPELIFKGELLETGDIIQVTLSSENRLHGEEVIAFEHDKFDYSLQESIDLPGELYE